MIDIQDKKTSHCSSNAFLSTLRTDTWWIEPLWTGLGFLAFALYTTWAAFQGNHYYTHSYLSPFYSPLLFVKPDVPGGAPLQHAWLGGWPSWWPSSIPASPALFILVGPLSFRMTCYYYRKFYYRAYFGSPPGCAVTALPRKEYKGETSLLLFQNIHRYTLYIALFYIAILATDAFHAFFKDGVLGIGMGSIVLTLNVIFLSCYTLGCHAYRHLMGGRADCFSSPKGDELPHHKIWHKVSCLNSNHMLWAWVSMIWVGFTDVYIRMVSMGIWKDFNTWGN